MPVEVCHPSELDAARWQRWRELWAADRELAHPFLSPTFAAAVGQHVDAARVAVVVEHGQPSAFWAFQVADDDVADPIGAGINDRQGVVHAPGWGWEPAALLEAAGVAGWRFDHLTRSQAGLVAEPEWHRSPVMDLRAGYDAFVAAARQRSKRVIDELGRKGRRLAREHGPLTVTWHDDRPDAFDALVEWKTAQYGRTGTWDRFARDWITDALATLAQASSEAPAVTAPLATLRAGDRLAAVHLGLSGPSVLAWWFPAYDPELGRASPGQVLLLALAERAAVRGLGAIDLGRGEHGYKLRLATADDWVVEGSRRASRGGEKPPARPRVDEAGR